MPNGPATRRLTVISYFAFRSFLALSFAATLSGLAIGSCIADSLGSDAIDAGGLDFRSVQTGKTNSVSVSDAGAINIRVTDPDNELSRNRQFREKMISVVRIDYLQLGQPRFCTGIGIDVRTILTAGHCACGDPLSYRISHYSRDLDWYTDQKLSALPIRFRSDSCRVPGQIVPGFDLALLRAGTDQFRKYPIFPLTHMMNVYRDPAVRRLTVVGFGLSDNGDTSKIPLAGHVDISSHFCSREPLSCARFQEFILSETLSIGDSVPTDTCGGDSGGPVFYARKQDGDPLKQELLLVGITSRATETPGNANALGCGGGGIYTAIGRSDVLRWLESNDVRIARRSFSPSE